MPRFFERGTNDSMSEYRENQKLTLDDLENHEQLALGGLLRVLIRADGSFSETEEQHLDAVADELGGRELLWKIISRSAQEHGNDDAIKADALKVERPRIRELIRGILEDVARAETIEPAEQSLLDWLDEKWELPKPTPAAD